MKIGIITADFNQDLTHNMKNIAIKKAEELGCKIIKDINVPGVFEIPFAVNKIIKDKDIEGIITIGVVKKGDTKHDEVVANNCAKKIMDLSVEYDKPVSLGVIGPCVTLKQAEYRHKDYAIRAAEAVVKMTKI